MSNGECVKCGAELNCGRRTTCRECGDKEMLRLMRESGTIEETHELEPAAFIRDVQGDIVQSGVMLETEPDPAFNDWEPLVRANDLPHLVEFIIQRLMEGNALDENGADKLRREVDEEFQIYGDSGLNSATEGDSN